MHPFGYDFSRIKSIQLHVKNNLPKFVLLMTSLAPVIMVTVGLILWLTGAPVNSNDHVYNPGTEEYNQFYVVYFVIILTILALSLFAGIIIKSSNSDYEVYLSDSVYLEPFIYMTSKRKIMYLTEKVAIIRHLTKDRIEVITNEDKITELRSNLLFWLDEPQTQNIKIKKKEYGGIITYQFHRGHKKIYKRINMKYDGAMHLVEYNETVNCRMSGNSNIQKMVHVYVEKFNTDVNILIDRVIQNQIDKMN